MVNPIALAVALARKILEALEKAKEETPASPGTGFELVQRHKELGEAVEYAFKADLDDLRGALGRLADVPGIRELAESAEGWGRARLVQNRMQLGAQRAALSVAQQRIAEALPQLRSQAASWRAISGALARVPELITFLEHVPGWDGAASTGYENQVVTRNRSSVKFSSSTASMPKALNLVAGLNHLLGTAVYTDIEMAKSQVVLSGSKLGFPGSFSRTRAAGAALQKLGQKLNEHLGLKTIQSRVDALEAEVNPVAEQLERPWPI